MRLVLFLTYGSSLESWRADGILERELALYKSHAEKHQIDIDIISYGNKTDLEIARDFPFLQVHCNKFNLHPRLYAVLLPVLHRKVIQRADVIKTNQLFGAHLALRSSRLWRTPVIVRQGYGYYEHRVEEHGEGSALAQRAKVYEQQCLSQADAIVFTTEALAVRALRRHALSDTKMNVIPNYIVPNVWKPQYKVPKGGEIFRLVFYGRFTEQKNLDCLINALTGLPVELTLIGEGELKEELNKLAQEQSVSCRFVGRMAQEGLKEELQKADAFVLPSLYEGHPKSLLETMAYGMPIVAADSPGISGELEHLETAILGDPTVVGLREAVMQVMAMSASERQKMGENARLTSVRRYSVESVSAIEYQLFQKIAETCD